MKWYSTKNSIEKPSYGENVICCDEDNDIYMCVYEDEFISNGNITRHPVFWAHVKTPFDVITEFEV